MPGDRQAVKGFRRKMLAAAVIYGLATLLASGLWGIHMRAENIIMIYLISVIVMMIEIQEFVWGTAYTVVCILTFNFLFTEPRFTLRVNDPNYVVTMGIFMAVSAITGLLVSRLGEQVRLAQRNENRMEALLEISSGYLTLSGMENIVYYGIKSLYQAAGERCVVYVAQGPGGLGKPYYIKSYFPEPGMLDNDTPAQWCYMNHTVCGANTGFYGDSGWVYLPIRNRDTCLGVIGVYTDGREIDDGHMVFINTVMSQMAMAIEKEGNPAKNGEHDRGCQGTGPKDGWKDQLEQELYHGFCLPLEDILKESDALGPGLRLKLCTLYNRLRNMAVQPCLDRAVPQDGENVDFAEAVSGAVDFYGRAGRERVIWIKKPQEPVLVHGDRELLKLAVSNVLDNALVHTPAREKVYISLGREQGYGILEVSDSGSGISFQELQHTLNGSLDSGTGLSGGLSVSRQILDKCQGSLVIKSSRYGGTAVILSLKATWN